MERKLKNLYANVDTCSFCEAARNRLQHIHGVGTLHPRLMLVLINPTHRNISSHPAYSGPRFPFIGVRQFWRVLANGNLIEREVAYGLPTQSEWQPIHTDRISKELIGQRLFVTNLVKCCYNHSEYPQEEIIAAHRELLGMEIKIVKPERIVTFGALVFTALTGERIHLTRYWQSRQKYLYRERISGLHTRIVPCFFPIGRGSPRQATRILRTL